MGSAASFRANPTKAPLIHSRSAKNRRVTPPRRYQNIRRADQASERQEIRNWNPRSRPSGAKTSFDIGIEAPNIGPSFLIAPIWEIASGFIISPVPFIVFFFEYPACGYPKLGMDWGADHAPRTVWRWRAPWVIASGASPFAGGPRVPIASIANHISNYHVERSPGGMPNLRLGSVNIFTINIAISIVVFMGITGPGVLSNCVP